MFVAVVVAQLAEQSFHTPKETGFKSNHHHFYKQHLLLLPVKKRRVNFTKMLLFSN